MAKGIKTGGRKAGTPNKGTAELKALCQGFTKEAVLELRRLSRESTSDQARVGAIKELLDRGYGRPAQSVGQDPDLGPVLISWGGEGK